MHVWGMTESQLQEIADNLGVTIRFGNPKGRALSCTLRWNREKTPDRYRHMSISYLGERNTNSVCFHGHFDFMYEVFDRNPDARIRTGLRGNINYHGREQFFEKVPAVARIPLGAPIMGGFPSMIESCDCGAFGYGIAHDIPSEYRQ